MSLFILPNDRACALLLPFDVVEFGSRFDPRLSVTTVQLLIVRKQMGNTLLFSLRSQFLYPHMTSAITSALSASTPGPGTSSPPFLSFY